MRFGDMVGSIKVTTEDLSPDMDTEEQQELATDSINEGQEDAEQDEFMSELKDDESQMNTANDVAQRSMNIASNLDALENASNQVIQENDGVLPSSAASMLSTTTESIMNKLGIEYKPVVSLEAFDSTWSKKEATRLTMESLTDGVKKAGRALIDALKKAVETVFKFLQGIFANRALLIMKIKSLIAKLDKIDNSATPNQDTLKGSFVKKLSFKGKSDFLSVKMILETSSNLNDLYTIGVSFMKDIRDGRVGDGLQKEFNGFLARNLGPVTVTVKTTDGRTLDGYGALVNSMSLTTNEEAMALSLVPNGHIEENIQMETPKVYEMRVALNKALVVLEDLKKAEKNVNTLKDLLKGIIRNVETEYSRLRSAMGSEEHAARVQLNEQAKAAQKLLHKMIGRLPVLVFNSAKYTSDWAQAAIAVYPVVNKS